MKKFLSHSSDRSRRQTQSQLGSFVGGRVAGRKEVFVLLPSTALRGCQCSKAKDQLLQLCGERFQPRVHYERVQKSKSAPNLLLGRLLTFARHRCGDTGGDGARECECECECECEDVDVDVDMTPPLK